jgi:hypothetical protein
MAAPVPPQPAFTALFNDVSKDPFDGIYGPLFAPFDISLTDASPTPDNVCQQIAAASNQHLPLAIVLLVNRLLRVYCLPFRRDQADGAPAVVRWEALCLRWRTRPRPRSSGGDPRPVVQSCLSTGTNRQLHQGTTGCRCLTHSHLGPLCWRQFRHCGNQILGGHGPAPQVCRLIPGAAQLNASRLLP